MTGNLSKRLLGVQCLRSNLGSHLSTVTPPQALSGHGGTLAFVCFSKNNATHVSDKQQLTGSGAMQHGTTESFISAPVK